MTRNPNIRLRFCPSPTGSLHIGGVRTALFSYLYAKQQGGTFILRIEDTDQARKVEGSEAQIIESLQWLGLTPDEGVMDLETDKGEYGPYTQSQRLDI
jgi:glutamyl/glutaminyl-tRNA synthetase